MSLLMAYGVGLWVIAMVRWAIHRLKGIQPIYHLSPDTHQHKTGVVTMGGLGLFLSIVITSGWVTLTPQGWWVVVAMGVFAGLGAIDDGLALLNRKNQGLTARSKFVLQTILGALLVLAWHVLFSPLSWLEIGWYTLLFNGVSNATNLTDGLDGLLAGLAVMTFFGLMVLCLKVNPTLLPICLIIMGSLLAFLVFNYHPARLFMGDTGSLSLGAGMTAVALACDAPFILLPLGALYVAETLSVMIQVTSFKLTKKRVFKMAPLHHHFELIGWSEPTVVRVFWAVSAVFLCATIGFMR